MCYFSLSHISWPSIQGLGESRTGTRQRKIDNDWVKSFSLCFLTYLSQLDGPHVRAHVSTCRLATIKIKWIILETDHSCTQRPRYLYVHRKSSIHELPVTLRSLRVSPTIWLAENTKWILSACFENLSFPHPFHDRTTFLVLTKRNPASGDGNRNWLLEQTA